MQKILIIEDDGDIAAIERDYLELDNFQVEIAADGLAGMERVLSGSGTQTCTFRNIQVQAGWKTSERMEVTVRDVYKRQDYAKLFTPEGDQSDEMIFAIQNSGGVGKDYGCLLYTSRCV